MPLGAQPPAPAPKTPALSPQVQRALRGGPITMNYENLDVHVLSRIVSEVTGKTILLDEGIKGTVTLLGTSSMTPEELWQVYQAVLLKSGFALRQHNGVYQVTTTADARRGSPYATAAVVLHEGDANQLLNAIKPLLSDPNAAQVYGPGKALVISDHPQTVAQVLRLVHTIDRATSSVKVETFFLRYAEAEKLAPILQQVLTRPQQAGQTGQFQPVVTAFPPTNAILVQATPQTMAELKVAMAQLDVAKASPLTVEAPRYFVYKLKQGKAEDVAKIVGDLLTERKRAQQEEEARRGRQAGNGNLNVPPPGAAGNTTDASAGNTSAGNTTGGPNQLVYVGARVGADTELNAVLVYVSPSEYPGIRALLDNLDRQRKQVLVHVVVGEVTLSKLLETGARLQLFDGSGPAASFNGGLTTEGLLSTLTGGSFVLGAIASQSTTINVAGRDVTVPGLFAFLSANRTTRDFDLLSAPRLVATDHKKAEMKVGNVVPFATGARFSNNSQPIVTYDYKDVGIHLQFTPHVSQSRVIRIELDQEIQEVTDFLQQNLGGFGYVIPLISNRRVKTDVNLKEGETLLIGGLISKRTSDTISKVPLLGDIPIIQNLFRTLRKEERKTSLFIALTPYIVNGPEDVAAVDEAYRRYLEKEGLPSQGEWEKRDTELSAHPIGDPYAGNPVDGAPALSMQPVQMLPPTKDDRLRQGRILVHNKNKTEAEVELRLRVFRPDNTVEEMSAGKVRLGPEETRNLELSPYPFPTIKGIYKVEASAYVDDREVARTSGVTKVEAP